METTQEKVMPHKLSIISEVIAFVKDVITWSLSGGLVYQIYLCILAALMVLGVYAYFVQLKLGMAATNMSDIVSWGFYIANFTFLVGVAAAAVMIILTADPDRKLRSALTAAGAAPKGSILPPSG